MINSIAKIGSYFIRLDQITGRSFLFLLKIILSPPKKLSHWKIVIKNIYKSGFQSLTIIICSSFFIGLVVTLQGNHTLEKFGAQSALSQLVALSVFRELGPVISAMLYAGRAGSAITAEISLMQATEQMDALSMMAVDPYRYVLSPKMIAGTIVLPMLTILFNAVAMLGSLLLANVWLGHSLGSFLGGIDGQVFFSPDVTQGIIKSFVFSILVNWTAIYQGYFSKKTSQGIGESTTKSVVISSLLILAADFLITAYLLRS